MIFVVILHSLICILLLTVILMQSGRGGGLTDTFAAAESMFGAKTNEFMVKVTTVLAVLFLTTSLSLAYFSAKKDQSLMDRIKNLPKIDLSKPSAKKDATPVKDAPAPDQAASPIERTSAETPAVPVDSSTLNVQSPSAPATTPETAAPASGKK